MSNVPTTDSEAMAGFERIIFSIPDLTERQRVALGLILGSYYGGIKLKCGDVQMAYVGAIESGVAVFAPKREGEAK